MKTRMGWMMIAGVVACGAVGAAWAAKKEISTLAAEDLRWTDVPDSGGVQVATVSGDMMKGAHAAFAKIPAGQMNPLHTHTSEVKAVVVSGTFLLGPEGGPEKKLGPGSHFTVPGGLKHTSGCVAGAACTIFQQSSGKFDMKPVGGAKPAEKK